MIVDGSSLSQVMAAIADPGGPPTAIKQALDLRWIARTFTF